MHLIGIIKSVILLLASNGAPILANNIFGNHANWAIDNHLTLKDGNRLFGKTKTWRGLLASVSVCVVIAILLDIQPLIGAIFAALAMAGDLLASFIKRRLGRIESSRARGLDVIPEALLPVWLLKAPLALGFVDIMLIVTIFFLIEEFVSPILYRWHIRRRPY